MLIAAVVWPRRAVEHRSVASNHAAGRFLWALLWVGAAGLWLLPGNRAAGGFHDVLTNGAGGEPAFLAGPIAHLSRLADGRGLAIALILAALSVAIGLGVLTRRPAGFLVAGAVLSLGFWAVGQTFGLLTGQATDPNAGPLFILLALALPPVQRAGASPPRRLGLDPRAQDLT